MTTDAELLPAVVYLVRQVTHRIGLSNKAAEHLDESVEALCGNVIEQAFGPDEEGQYDILVLHRPRQVVIARSRIRAYPSITLGLETIGI